MNYLEQLHNIITSAMEVEEDATFMDEKATVRRAIRAKSLLRETKKQIDIMLNGLEEKKKELIKDGAATKELATEIEKEFSN